jgi:DNA-binding MarR family transcriptional regulator
MKSRKELIEQYSRAVQQSGTLTVLHTNAISHKIGLSATEFEALDIISQRQPITAGHLATFCGLTTGAITGLVDRLESAGFAKRAIDQTDRRRVLISTVENRRISKKVSDLYRPISDAFDEFISGMSDEEIAFLLDKQTCMNHKVEDIIAQMHKK